jgi:pimeloyl-ACP methyl ester carboxylesterase
MSDPWTHHFARVNGVRLHYVEAGAGPLVLLLHGFPEFWYAWRHQLAALAAAGFRAVAPDLRGYNLSDKPKGVRPYRIEALVDDVAELVRHLGGPARAVAGHDWGGGIAWDLPVRHPGCAERLVVLNAPPPGAFLRELRTLGQLRRSWYIFFFQLPWLPELFFRLRRPVCRMLRADPVRPGAFSAEDIARYEEALARPGALTAAINYYRAAVRRFFQRPPPTLPPILTPTLLIWGERDRYLGPRLTEGLSAWVPNLRVERLPDSSHWVMSDAPERVNQLLIDFLSESCRA